MVNDNKAKGGRLNLIKWGLWFPWLAAIAFFAARAGGFSRIDFFFQTTQGVSVAQPGHYIVYYIFLGLIAALSLTAGRRAFCHYVCWMAPFMILGRQMGHTLALPALSLEADKSKRTACRSCDQSCPMSLNVLKMVQQGQLAQAECNLCAECADACPQEVISLSFSRLRPKSPTPARTP
jgi:polyferredoxin